MFSRSMLGHASYDVAIFINQHYTALNFIYDKLTYIINLMFSSSNNHQHHFNRPT
jgi:hypothetical protein